MRGGRMQKHTNTSFAIHTHNLFCSQPVASGVCVCVARDTQSDAARKRLRHPHVSLRPYTPPRSKSRHVYVAALSSAKAATMPCHHTPPHLHTTTPRCVRPPVGPTKRTAVSLFSCALGACRSCSLMCLPRM